MRAVVRVVLLPHEERAAKQEALVGTSFGLCDYMLTVEAREAFVIMSFGFCDYIRTWESPRAATRYFFEGVLSLQQA